MTFSTKPGHVWKPGRWDTLFLLTSPIRGTRAKVFAPRGYWHEGTFGDASPLPPSVINASSSLNATAIWILQPDPAPSTTSAGMGARGVDILAWGGGKKYLVAPSSS